MPDYKYTINPHTGKLQKVHTDEYILALCPGSSHFNVLPFSYDSIGQGTWEYVYDEYQFAEGMIYNSSNVNGDNISYKIGVMPGTYTLIFFAKTHPAYGIVDITIDDVEIASFDLYNANNDNVRQVETGIVISNPGLKTLKLTVDGKNVLSSNYFVAFTYITLYRTA